MNITLKQLTVFHAVARAGSLTQAADRLFISKNALSQSLAEIESHLGVRFLTGNTHDFTSIMKGASCYLWLMNCWHVCRKYHVC